MTMNHSHASATPAENPQDSLDRAWDHDGQFEAVKVLLETGRTRNKRVAIASFVLGFFGVVLAVYLAKNATHDGVQVLKDGKYSYAVVAYELVRTAAVAALLAAAIWGTLNIARAALDQSTRYEKRLIAGHFLVFMMKRFDSKIPDGSIQIDQVLSVFNTWSANVETAYTHVKYGSKKGQDIAITSGPQGLGLATGSQRLPSADAK